MFHQARVLGKSETLASAGMYGCKPLSSCRTLPLQGRVDTFLPYHAGDTSQVCLGQQARLQGDTSKPL